MAPRPTRANDEWDYRRREYIPIGLLVMESRNRREPVLCQDTENGQRIENSVNDVIVGLVAEVGRQRSAWRTAEEAKRLRAEEERLWREREAELQRRRTHLQELQTAEQARVAKLMADATSWERSCILRAYITRIEEVVVARDDGIVERGEFAQWLVWARQQADRLDPLIPSPPSVLDEKL
jgi:hypothetical protein